MSTVSSAIPSSVYAAYMPQYNGPQTNNSSLVQAAASLSEEAGILSSLGSASTIPQTSSATSLLSWFLQPFSTTSLPLPTLGQGDVSTLAQEGLSQQILSGQNSSSNTGIYNATGTLSSTAASNWTALMQNNPSLAAAMNNDATNLGIINQLSTYA